MRVAEKNWQGLARTFSRKIICTYRSKGSEPNFSIPFQSVLQDLKDSNDGRGFCGCSSCQDAMEDKWAIENSRDTKLLQFFSLSLFNSSRNVTEVKYGGECPSEVASCYATDVNNWNDTMADRCKDMGCHTCNEVSKLRFLKCFHIQAKYYCLSFWLQVEIQKKASKQAFSTIIYLSYAFALVPVYWLFLVTYPPYTALFLRFPSQVTFLCHISA